LIPLLAIAASAGCFSDKGAVLRIDVSAATGTTDVELFLTSRQCSPSECSAVKPMGRPLISGEVWLRYDTQSRFQAKVEGHIAAIHPKRGNEPALIDLAFDRLRFPNGRSVKIDGNLTSLDADHVYRNDSGVLVANTSNNQTDQRMVYAGYGAGAGLLVGLLTKKPLEGTILGGAIGYLLGQAKKQQQTASDITLRPGTEMGVRVNNDVVVTWE